MSQAIIDHISFRESERARERESKRERGRERDRTVIDAREIRNKDRRHCPHRSLQFSGKNKNIINYSSVKKRWLKILLTCLSKELHI